MATDNLEDQTNEYCSSIRLFVMRAVAKITENVPCFLARPCFIEIFDQGERQGCLAAAWMACQPKKSIFARSKPRNEEIVAANPLASTWDWIRRL